MLRNGCWHYLFTHVLLECSAVNSNPSPYVITHRAPGHDPSATRLHHIFLSDSFKIRVAESPITLASYVFESSTPTICSRSTLATHEHGHNLGLLFKLLTSKTSLSLELLSLQPQRPLCAGSTSSVPFAEVSHPASNPSCPHSRPHLTCLQPLPYTCHLGFSSPLAIRTLLSQQGWKFLLPPLSEDDNVLIMPDTITTCAVINRKCINKTKKVGWSDL